MHKSETGTYASHTSVYAPYTAPQPWGKQASSGFEVEEGAEEFVGNAGVLDEHRFL